MTGYADYLVRAARLHGTRRAIVDGARECTFAELDRRTRRLAGGMRHLGIRVGDRVADLGGNRLEALELDFGLARGGYVRVALTEASPLAQQRAMLADCEPVAIVCGPGFEEQARALAADVRSIRMVVVEVPDAWLCAGEHRYSDVLAAGEGWSDEPFDGTELLSLRYTGGTTGPPKGVLRTHNEQVAVATSILLDLCDLRDDDVVMHATPLSHGANPYVLPAVIRGALQVVVKPFDADELLALIERHRGTVTKIVPPTMLQALIEARGREPGSGRDLRSLRLLIMGSASLPDAVLEEAQQALGPVVAQTYGQTEMPLGIVCASPSELADRRGPHGFSPTGRPYSLCDVAVRTPDGQLTADEQVLGEVMARPPIAARGYWGRDDDAAAPDGWRGTGDVGCFDSDGYLYILGRSEERMRTADGSVFPRTVEEVLYRHPAVREAAVVDAGDESVAAVVACRESRHVDADELRAFCATHLLAAAVPGQIVVVDALPKSPTGKILRRRVRELLVR